MKLKLKLILILLLPTINVFGQNTKIEKSILISSGYISKSKVVKINAVNFDLVLKNRDTVYLQTTESKFVTKEGISVGKKFSELPIKIKQGLTKENGWGYYYKLPSGWSIGFCEGNSCTESYPNENSKIKWMFKRK
ncbi:hypothetical protein KBJ98_15015 [Flavobacterium sp. F-328]|uniref:DUF4430 domain-containing protein n=1 Tax=Flavobacterium erciyesense TaxID=2825842 RepID=A0ABS5D7Q2_9FLAO|nr:hypothetical protein [Flavobacterium erciyesense]MBQ0910021.1 hypothetical protein [Flavobacterium erciyesense]